MQLTFSDLTVAALTRERKRVAFVHGDQLVTYAQAADLTGRLTRVLTSRGFGAGHGLAILAPPQVEAYLVTVAAAMVGGRYTALHPLGSVDDHVFMCDDAEIHTLVVDSSSAERAAELKARTSTVRNVFSIGSTSDFEDIVELAHRADATPLRSGTTDPEDICYLAYTGGTTGTPKGVQISQRAMASSFLTALAEYELPLEMRYLAASPITHAAGMFVLPTLLRRGTVHLHDQFDPARYLRAIESERITICFGVPTMLYALLDDPEIELVDRSSLERLVYAASPMSPARLAEGLERFGPIFTQYYAQTECAAGTVLTSRDHDPRVPGRLASCGQPVLSVQLRLEGVDGRPVETGQPGEICLRSPSAMSGYWKQPDLTAETTRGGWVHTGDVATRDEDGFLTIVDRLKDMVVSGGFNIFPREIENVLTSHPAVASAAVIGVPDDRWGEAVTAVVVVRKGHDVSATELRELVRAQKGSISAPKQIEFVDTIPLTPVGKADKRTLRATYWSDHDRGVN